LEGLAASPRQVLVSAPMIDGAHTIVFAHDPEAARAFAQDVLGFRAVDAGGGWLVFELPPAELAFHPGEGRSRHELYLMCQDLDRTRAELEAKGVEFVAPISEQRWGRTTRFAFPGAGELGLYEPAHPSPLERLG
jgi:catechol 2,3-dioxygenase-like lactoylglutathione lyase family enzyme